MMGAQGAKYRMRILFEDDVAKDSGWSNPYPEDIVWCIQDPSYVLDQKFLEKSLNIQNPESVDEVGVLLLYREMQPWIAFKRKEMRYVGGTTSEERDAYDCLPGRLCKIYIKRRHLQTEPQKKQDYKPD